MHGHAGVVKKISTDLKIVTNRLAEAQKQKHVRKQINNLLKISDLVITNGKLLYVF